ncbi:hypothetical protein LEP1GSC195_3542 [Leptospira wolbachii serovar Codice str. CDC]|uniref:Uncharacterized protein n=1 Tax=Leptospira wolbachii serovar Codice str. CDC TaxID=1218599 RepID=R9A045_9LEPT|nr:hypothetical protein LEP1GSC195_3542 [Leptospira wolbachii serovar Codice str. CDC]
MKHNIFIFLTALFLYTIFLNCGAEFAKTSLPEIQNSARISEPIL